MARALPHGYCLAEEVAALLGHRHVGIRGAVGAVRQASAEPGALQAAPEQEASVDRIELLART
eukprot:2341433-Alexandrium_andersonii.AAC.1